MKINEYTDLINDCLKKAIQLRNPKYHGLYDAMTYSLNAGGKRIRPVLVLEFCRITGNDFKKAIPAACAIEMLHTYSLIHDDLPCMDNDDLRRGRPTNHIVFGECNAVLAGDALLTEAFYQITSSDLEAKIKAETVKVLSGAAGLNGMCGGQYLDTNYDGELSEEDIVTINTLKTGALLKAACMMGVICANGSEEQICAASEFGDNIGRAFQIRDDMLDVIGNREQLGKSTGSDTKDNKINYMSLYGNEYCIELIDKLTEKAKDALRQTFSDTAFLFDLADSLTIRKF